MADEKNTAAQAVDQNADMTPEDAEKFWRDEAARRTDPDAPKEPPVTAAAEVQEEVHTELPEELKQALAQVDGLKTFVTQLQHQVKSSEGRVAALQREMQVARQAAVSVAAPAPNAQAVAAANKSPEKWEKLKEEFPEWGEAVEELVSVRAQPQQPAPQVDLSPIHTQLNDLTRQVYRAVEEAKVFGAHRDWKQVINTPQFVAWAQTQPPEVQALGASDSAEDAITMIDRYKSDTQKVRDASRNVPVERSARLAAAAAPARRGTVPPPPDDRELTAEQIWAQESGRMAQRRSARN